AAGNFSLTTALPLDHYADGLHTVHLRAFDRAGNASAVSDVAFTLDTRAPTVGITSPASGLVTNGNITVTGQTTDDRTGLATAEAAVDGGPFAPVSFDAGGNFSLITGLPLDHSADGPHTVHFRAADRAGNVSALADLSFTLDTIPPAVNLTSPAPGVVTNQ